MPPCYVIQAPHIQPCMCDGVLESHIGWGSEFVSLRGLGQSSPPWTSFWVELSPRFIFLTIEINQKGTCVWLSSCICIASNATSHNQPYRNRLSLSQKKILSREIAIKFVRSNDQLIDIFTKFPTGYMYSKLVYAPTRGEN